MDAQHGKDLSGFKKEWSGTIILVAQPAEEPITGAKAMVTDGLWTKYNLPKPNYFFAVHTTPAPVASHTHRGHAWREPISSMFYLKVLADMGHYQC
jgi:metal-dependent amidase/aminoacylase/carboxypeptidase family protein